MRKSLLLFGMPGSGKGTQKEKIKDRYDFVSITLGDLLRERAKTDIKYKETLETGKLFPDVMVIDLMEKAIESYGEYQNFIFDGFPRKESQVKIYSGLAEKYGFETMALLIRISKQEAMKRLSTRYVCDTCDHVSFKEGKCKCGGTLIKRVDDNPEAINVRLGVFDDETRPVIDYFQNRGEFLEIDGEGSFDEVTQRIFEKLDKYYKK